jgi:long-subunit acyl-CoA synthetase (AMP-forming)
MDSYYGNEATRKVYRHGWLHTGESDIWTRKAILYCGSQKDMIITAVSMFIAEISVSS